MARKHEPLEVVDSSGLTDDDWAKINRLRHLHESGGSKALSKALDELQPIERVRARLEALIMANGAPRCGAQSKRTGKPCRAAAMPNGRCKVHGGNLLVNAVSNINALALA
jgi:hypothetical protein